MFGRRVLFAVTTGQHGLGYPFHVDEQELNQPKIRNPIFLQTKNKAMLEHANNIIPWELVSFQIEPDFSLFSNVNSKRCKFYFSNLSSCTFLVSCCSSFVFDVKPGLQLEPCDLADDPTRARQLEVINQIRGLIKVNLLLLFLDSCFSRVVNWIIVYLHASK